MVDSPAVPNLRQSVTAFVMTRNEEEILPRCLEKLTWADELLIVDSFSTDRTVEIARGFGARVLQHRFNDFSSQTNWGLKQAACDWTLQIDADEMVTPELRNSVLATLADNPTYDAYSVRRDSIVFGRLLKSTAWSGEWLPRLFRKGTVKFSGMVHQTPELGGRQAGKLDGKLVHYTYRSVDKYFEKFQLYSTLWAEKAREKGRRTSLPKASASALWRSFHDYFIRGGIRDGRIGFALAALAGMHTFIRHIKLWGIQNREDFVRTGIEEKSDDA